MNKSQIQILKRARVLKEKAVQEDHESRLNDVEVDFDDLDTALVEREDLVEKLEAADKEIQQLAAKFDLEWKDGKLIPTVAQTKIPIDDELIRVISHKRKRPRKAAGRRAGAGKRAARTVAANEQPLATHILRYMAENPGSHSASEIAAAVKKAGYKSHAKDFRGVVQQCMHHVNLFRRFGRDMWGLSSVGAVAKRDLD